MIPSILHSHLPMTILATERVIHDAISTRSCRLQNYFSNKPTTFDSWVRFTPSDYASISIKDQNQFAVHNYVTKRTLSPKLHAWFICLI